MTRTIPGARDLAGRRIAVLGLGISGRASLEALHAHTEAIVSGWDSSNSALDGLEGDLQAHDEPTQLVAALVEWAPDVVVIAPGFPQTGGIWSTLLERGVTVWSEIELAWHLRSVNDAGEAAPWLCITGTNGKTTTVTMLESILQAAGLRGIAVGNVGTPAVTAVSNCDHDAPEAFAFELSSFQLAATYSMEPAASVVLNISDDHLEWHGDFKRYAEAKARIYTNVSRACLFPIGDRSIQAMVDDADVIEGARAVALSMGVPSVGEVGFVHDVAVDRAFTKNRYTQAAELFTVDDLMQLAPSGSHLPLHIAQDAMAAAALARSIGVEAQYVAEGLRNYHPGHHRIELVETVDGVVYVDDSKATNAHAAKASLLAQQDGAAVWIAGGVPKGARFEGLVEQVKSRLKAVVVIGVDQDPWRDALAKIDVPVEYVDPQSSEPMADAVVAAQSRAESGNTVILAPACASFDQFTSYGQRGDKFAEAVRALAGDRG